jgi:putative Ca2+/H+ antiporter (TMEM165/GDT1 family)
VGPLLGAVGLAFATIFLAELGDKTQLLVLSLSARLPVRTVIAGTTLAIVLIFGVSVAIGDLIGTAIPRRPLAAVAAVAFLAFGLKTLLDGDDDAEAEEEEQAAERASKRGSVLAVFGAFLIAEIGDKSMLATITLAGRYPALGVWVGAVAAETVLCTGAALVGRGIAAKVPPRTLRIGAAVMFFVLGTLMLVDAIRS